MMKTYYFMLSWSRGLLNCWDQILLEDLVGNFWMSGYEVFSIYSDKHIQFESSCNNMYCEIGMSSPGSAELLLRLSEEGDQVSRLLICSY